MTLKSYPGERATLVGRLYIRRQAPYVTVANLNLNGRNAQTLPSPDIAAGSGGSRKRNSVAVAPVLRMASVAYASSAAKLSASAANGPP